jgi:NADH:ubiquinone oxidoreductase subunit E
MINKTQIKICLGSSCFSRGNRDIVKQVQKFIADNELDDKVALRGDHCFNDCHQGPNIRIAGKLVYGITNENLISILNEHLKDL